MMTIVSFVLLDSFAIYCKKVFQTTSIFTFKSSSEPFGAGRTCFY